MHLSDNALPFTNVIAASPSRQSAWGGGALGGWGGKSCAFDHLPVGYAPPIVAANQARCNETYVGVAAEQHRREMEERLREILGDAGLVICRFRGRTAPLRCVPKFARRVRAKLCTTVRGCRPLRVRACLIQVLCAVYFLGSPVCTDGFLLFRMGASPAHCA